MAVLAIAIWFISIPAALAYSPEIITPKEGVAVIENTPIVLSFMQLDTATRYHVRRYDSIAGSWSYSNSQVDLRSCDGSICKVVADGLPEQNNARWQVRALSVSGWGAWSTPESFAVLRAQEPARPIALSPKDGARVDIGSPITLSFMHLNSADQYHVRRFDSVASRWSYKNSQVLLDACVAGVCQVVTPGLPAQANARWQVRAHDGSGWGAWSSAESFKVAALQLPQQPQTLSPKNGSRVNVGTPITLSFREVDTATRYHIRRFDSVESRWSYSRSDIHSTACDRGICQVEVDGLVAQNNARWQVRANNSAGWGAWSSVNTFTVAQQSTPAKPEILAPLHCSTVAANAPITVSFEEVFDASRYHVRRYDDAADRWTYSNSHVDSSVCSDGICYFDVDGLESLSSGRWQVRAFNGSGWGGWSEIGFFAVD